ncbi:MAG: putative rane protein [Bryobacterales bacterium]|nr:putative rane protein [Bryobacterales bacterium]
MLTLPSIVRPRKFILLFGVLNAILYSCCLPLWEGFDEAFHYAYVETLWHTRAFPTLGRALVPVDVVQSFTLVPVGPVVHAWIPEATTYDNWFRLPVAEKEHRRAALEKLRPVADNSTRPNYEAHHAPLAYIFLAGMDWWMAASPLPSRVLVLRLFGAIASVLLVFFGSLRLCRLLALQGAFTDVLLFIVFCSQMLYATVAHVANDWLAIGISVMLLAAVVEVMLHPNATRTMVAVAWLAAALLTKAYFLPMVFVLAVLPRRWILPACGLLVLAAGPWYVRNLAIYHNVTGIHEAFEGIGVRQTLAAATQVDWPSTAAFLARGSLWTGNASFTTFSRGTLHVMLAFLFGAMIVWCAQPRLIRAQEKLIAAVIVMFSAAIAYASCAAFVHMGGDSPGSGPWYTQILLVPVLLLAHLGMARATVIGRWMAICMSALWTWMLIATWVVKLFPMYSGATSGPLRIRELWVWYTRDAGRYAHDFSLLALAKAPLLYAGMLMSVLGSLLLAFFIIKGLASGRRWADPEEVGFE